jgi:hypothetical protein
MGLGLLGTGMNETAMGPIQGNARNRVPSQHGTSSEFSGPLEREVGLLRFDV